MTFDDLVGYIGHVAYMCMHATSNTYTDRAFRSYDKAVHDRAKENGLSAFSMGDHELNILHFNYKNTHTPSNYGRESRIGSRAGYLGYSGYSGYLGG